MIGIALFASKVSFINALCSKTTVRNVSSKLGVKGRVIEVISEPHEYRLDEFKILEL